jgi:hypothetical protein
MARAGESETAPETWEPVLWTAPATGPSRGNGQARAMVQAQVSRVRGVPRVGEVVGVNHIRRRRRGVRILRAPSRDDPWSHPYHFPKMVQHLVPAVQSFAQLASRLPVLVAPGRPGTVLCRREHHAGTVCGIPIAPFEAPRGHRICWLFSLSRGNRRACFSGTKPTVRDVFTSEGQPLAGHGGYRPPVLITVEVRMRRAVSRRVVG